MDYLVALVVILLGITLGLVGARGSVGNLLGAATGTGGALSGLTPSIDSQAGAAITQLGNAQAAPSNGTAVSA